MFSNSHGFELSIQNWFIVRVFQRHVIHCPSVPVPGSEGPVIMKVPRSVHIECNVTLDDDDEEQSVKW